MKSTNSITRSLRRLTVHAVTIVSLSQLAFGQSVARQWNDDLLAAIRIDFPAPTVHARNLFHLSAAMYDAWAAYDPTAVGVFHNEEASSMDVTAAREKAISFAAYRVLSSRALQAVDPVATQTILDARMTALGYDSSIVTTSGTSPEAVGNRIAAAVIARGMTDNSNEANGYVDNTSYAPVNLPLQVSGFGVGAAGLVDQNRWQPLSFDTATTQNDLDAELTQTFVGPHWGYVRPFALSGPSSGGVYTDIDPGDPPYLSGDGMASDIAMKEQVNEVIKYSGRLDPNDGVMIDISPASLGNNTLGQNDGTGYIENPATPGMGYTTNTVKRGDYGRVIAEFWADGPDSETPPGHWNVVANEVFEHASFERKLGGAGPVLPALEWDVKAYLALNAALHDTAIGVWGVKRSYDYVRPITLIRYMFGKGQSSDSMQPQYNIEGLLLETGVVERRVLVPGPPTATLVVRAWGIPFVPTIPGVPPPPPQPASVDWRPALTWLPYQRDTFVTPAFAGYVSGHSGFSRAAAEVLTAITGSEYFPGGLGTYTFTANSLDFDTGPATDVELQWATYYDAADEAGVSRIYGGIHVAADDGPGRIMGSKIGKGATERALKFINGTILDDFSCDVKEDGAGVVISWPCVANYRYQLQSSPTPDFTTFTEETTLVPVVDDVLTFTVATQNAVGFYYRVLREEPLAP